MSNSQTSQQLAKFAQSVSQERERGIQEIHEKSAQRIEQHLLDTFSSSMQKTESVLTTLETTVKKAQSELEKQPSILGEIRATILEQNKTLMKEHHEQMKAMSQELMKTLELLKTELLAESKRVAKQEAQKRGHRRKRKGH